MLADSTQRLASKATESRNEKDLDEEKIEEQIEAWFNEALLRIPKSTSTTDEVVQALLNVIEDDGEGMSPDFIRDRLFEPFESTKGVSGMGVGVYQSRDRLL